MMRIKLDQASWERGHFHGRNGLPFDCPPECDRLSYASGYIEGKAVRQSQRVA